MKNKYQLTIKIDGMSGKSSPIAEGKEKESKDTKRAVGGLVAFELAESFLKRTINTEASLVGIRTGSSELQNRVNLAMQGAEMIYGAGKNLVMGAILGKSLGSMGAGLTVGLITTAISFVVNIAQNSYRIQAERLAENEALSVTRNRMGFAFNQSRRGVL